jgi:hypothetical protein
MKWLNRLAQGFNPGKAPASESPCKGGRDGSVFSSRCCIQYQRNRSGSVLVYVLALVVIAGLIAASYLVFVDNQRARTGRNLDQDGLRISTEQALLRLESTVRSELLATGEVKLEDLNQTETASGLSLGLTCKTDASGSGVLQVQPFASTVDTGQLSSLEDQDLFGSARARVTLVDVDITASSAVPNVRLADLKLSDHPQIAVREIPVSQFTVFSAGDPVALGTSVFNEDIGRVFSESTVSVSGKFSSEFAVIAAQNVNLSDLDASLQVKDPSSNTASVTLSGAGTQSKDFLAEARTELDSRIVTGSVLPIDSAALNSVYGAPNSSPGTSNGLNLSLLKSQCDLLVVARPDITITAPNGKKECLVTVVGNVTGANLVYPQAMNTPAPQSQGTSPRQTVAFAAAQSKQNPVQTILALDYARLGSVQVSSVFLVVQDPAGNPLPNAVILVRGAQVLAAPISIVSPHPIIIAGDFNVGAAAGDTPAASIITPANLQTVVANWGSDLFGNI